jgi:RNase P subunit RPR2
MGGLRLDEREIYMAEKISKTVKVSIGKKGETKIRVCANCGGMVKWVKVLGKPAHMEPRHIDDLFLGVDAVCTREKRRG